jgi:putative polyketide hydroxylase
MEIGYKYHSSAVLSDEDDDGALHEDPRESRGRPGTRAPHLFLDCAKRAGERVSTLDLFGRNFVLLAGEKGGEWRDAARAAAARIDGVNVDSYVIGPSGDFKESGDAAGRFSDVYGILPSGAVLVRPDGFVAWRAREMSASPQATQAVLIRAVSSIVSR